MVAEAQGGGITPTGPVTLHAGENYAYTANVTIPSLNDFEIQLNVYKGRNLTTAVLSYDLWVYGPTTLTYSYSQLVTFAPPCAAGEKYTFKAKLITTNPVLSFDATPVIITVSATSPEPEPEPESYLQPSKPFDLAVEAIDRDRRHEA
jgi:hypothetical protein